jgi:hypothetical protein
LLDVKGLEAVKCPKIPALFDVLRRHPNLQFIECGLVPKEPVINRGVAEFWALYDSLPR